MTDAETYLVRTPLFPLYSEVQRLLRIFEGVKKSAVRSLIAAISEQMGTPQNPVDWTDPDTWIDERLTGDNRDLAHRIWTETEGTVNPRHISGSYLFFNRYALLFPDANDIYQMTSKGEGFLASDSAVLRDLDIAEGLPKLLTILAAHSPAKRGDLVDEWGDFLLERSKFGTSSTIRDTLRRRMLNLVERGFVTREGNTYAITESGLRYATETETPEEIKPHQEVLRAIKTYNDTQTGALRERLENMDPYRFESLIKDLLEAMDYEDVTVTKQSGDKGVDVIANYQFGITQIKEVVQVKRHKGSITRPILDQLRGALPYHEAIRGTIITLGRFAKGCRDAALYPGAAPITLIDGDKLIELLLKHGVGVKRRPQSLMEIDESYFSEPEADDETGTAPTATEDQITS